MPADYDVLTSRKDAKGKYVNTKIGAGFINEQSGSISIVLNALPLSGDDGVARLTLFKYRPREDRPAGDYEQREEPKEETFDSFGDDRIPF